MQTCTIRVAKAPPTTGSVLIGNRYFVSQIWYDKTQCRSVAFLVNRLNLPTRAIDIGCGLHQILSRVVADDKVCPVGKLEKHRDPDEFHLLVCREAANPDEFTSLQFHFIPLHSNGTYAKHRNS